MRPLSPGTVGNWQPWFCMIFWFCCAAQAGLELEILLPQPPEGWDYRWEPTCPILPIDLRAFRGRLRFSPSFPSSSGTLGCVEVRRRDGDAGGQSGKVTPAWGGNMDQAGLVSAMGTGSQGTGCQGPGGHPPFRRLGLHEVSSDRGR
jgi:hypothetical protein